MTDLIKLAEKYCVHYHEGQKRKSNNLPYAVHPFMVRDILVKYGYDTVEEQVIALLHDTIEDTDLLDYKKEIEDKFGKTVYNSVYVLSNNTITKNSDLLINLFDKLGVNYLDDNNSNKLSNEAYKTRLLFHRDAIKRVKIADMIHNTQTLEALSEKGIKKKLTDAETFYIPLGKRIAPEMVKELMHNIDDYMKRT